MKKLVNQRTKHATGHGLIERSLSFCGKIEIENLVNQAYKTHYRLLTHPLDPDGPLRVAHSQVSLTRLHVARQHPQEGCHHQDAKHDGGNEARTPGRGHGRWRPDGDGRVQHCFEVRIIVVEELVLIPVSSCKGSNASL